MVPAPSNRGMGAVLCAWAVVVLDAAVPRYACCGWGGPKIDREITERSDGVGHISSRRGPPGPIDMPHTPETSTKARRVVDTPAGVEKISSEECMAASSLIRWGGPAAVLGGLSTTFVSGLLPSPYPPNDGK